MPSANSTNAQAGRLRCAMYEMGEARHGLQVLIYSLLLLGFGFYVLVAVAFPMTAIVPQWPWLPALLATLVPGASLRVMDFAAAYPWDVAVAVLVLYAVRRAALTIGRSQAELAYQMWAGGGANYRVGTGTRVLTRSAPPPWLTGTLTSVVLVYAFLELAGLSVAGVERQPAADVEQPSSQAVSDCRAVRWPICWLAPGTNVRVIIRADQPHNRTGILLDACGTYEAKSIGARGWQDRYRDVEAEGFDFESNFLGVPRFSWIEWRRPFPEGRWFQVVARIDRRNPVFEVLDAGGAAQHYRFTPPHAGELVLFVNDVVYRNNRGIMELQIGRTDVTACDESKRSVDGEREVRESL